MSADDPQQPSSLQPLRSVPQLLTKLYLALTGMTSGVESVSKKVDSLTERVSGLERLVSRRSAEDQTKDQLSNLTDEVRELRRDLRDKHRDLIDATEDLEDRLEDLTPVHGTPLLSKEELEREEKKHKEDSLEITTEGVSVNARWTVVWKFLPYAGGGVGGGVIWHFLQRWLHL